MRKKAKAWYGKWGYDHKRDIIRKNKEKEFKKEREKAFKINADTISLNLDEILPKGVFWPLEEKNG